MNQGKGQEKGEKGATDNPAERERTVFHSLIIDFLLWIPDIFAAIFSGSITLFADVLKCGNEILATFIAWLMLRKMNRGATGIYDYGMGKLETLTSIITGGVMFISLILVFFTAVQRIIFPVLLHPHGLGVGIVLMIIGVLTNTRLWLKNHRIAKAGHSPIMEAQWRLFRTKAFSDLSVLLSLVLSLCLAGYPWSPYIDPIASFIIVAFLLYSGYSVISTSLPDLLDKTLDESLQLVIVQDLAGFYHDYTALHGVRSRRSGSNVYIEIFLEFDGDKKMGEVQDVINRIRSSLEQKIPKSSVSIIPTTEPLSEYSRDSP